MDLNKRKKDEDEILDTGVNNYPNLGSKDTVKKLAEDYANYNYDTFAGGDSYKALEKRYQAGGQKAMQDTVGQVSKRTGGLASSYATVAGQQTYNDWMGNLESAARALYDSERQEMGDRYALANSMYLQDRDEQRYADELAYNRGRDQLADQRYAEELAYNRQWNEDERTYNRQWNEDERDYNRSESSRLEGEGKAYDTVVALINAGTPIDEIDPALIAQTGYDPSHFDAMAKSYTDNQTKETLNSYMSAMADGVFVDRQAFIDANGDPTVYDAYKTAYDEAKAKGEAEDKATVATSALNALIATNADVDWDSEEIQQLITDSGRSPLEWNALIAQAQEEAKADADAKAAEEIAAAEENAVEEMITRLTSGETLEQIGSGLMASTGKSDKYWQAYERILRSGEAKEAEEFYKVDYEDAANWMAEMEAATNYEEAMDIAALVASSSGNWDFADELLTSWMNKYKNTPAG